MERHPFQVAGRRYEFIEQLFTPIPCIIDHENQLVGNKEGMSILATLKTIKSDLHQREIAAHTIRASALDGWAGINSDRTDRNGFVHGGDILGDISIISLMDTVDTEKALIWKGVFRRNYYVSFTTCTTSNRLGQADERLVEIFNIYANTQVLHRLKRPEAADTVTKVQSCCLKIFEASLTNGNDIFENPFFLGPYKTAVALHYS